MPNLMEKRPPPQPLDDDDPAIAVVEPRPPGQPQHEPIFVVDEKQNEEEAECASDEKSNSPLATPAGQPKLPPKPPQEPTRGGGGAAGRDDDDRSLLPAHANRLLRLLGEDDTLSRRARQQSRRSVRRRRGDNGDKSGTATSSFGLASATQIVIRDVVPTLAGPQCWEVASRLLGRQGGRHQNSEHLGSTSWPVRTQSARVLQHVAHRLSVLDTAGAANDDDENDDTDAVDDETSKISNGVKGPILTLDWLRDNWKRLSREDACLLMSRSFPDGRLDDRDDDFGEEGEDVDSTTLQEQLSRQTQILHRRLGLSGHLNQSSSGKSHQNSNDSRMQQLQLTMEDLSETASGPWMGNGPKKHGRHVRKRRRTDEGANPSRGEVGTTAESVDRPNRDEGGPMTKVGALPALLESLVNHGDAGLDRKHRHDVVTVDLMCRMVDPAWHVRHGAMLGALALIRGEWIPRHRRAERSSWILSILAASMYVLALDRFGDFSGALLEDDPSIDLGSEAQEDRSSTILASSVVAPVREVAGQVVAEAWSRLSPQSMKFHVLGLLGEMSRDEDEWEIRHGALTALKYMTVLALSSDESLKDEASVKLLIMFAADKLQDDSDDVVSVAADLLYQYFQHCSAHPQSRGVGPLETSNVTETVVPRLWKRVLTAKSHSSCLVNLLDLLRLFVQRDCRGFLLQIENGRYESSDRRTTPPAVTLAETLARLLDSEFTSVRVAVFQCARGLALPLAEQSAATRNCDAYVLLLDRVYGLFWGALSLTAVDHGSEEASDHVRHAVAALQSARSEAWQALVAHAQLAFAGQGGIKRMNFTCSLLRSYFNVHDPNRSRLGFDVVEAASVALSSFLLAVETVGEDAALPSIVELYLLSFLRSPWLAHCEAACLLISSLSRQGDSPFRRRLLDLLWDTVSGSIPAYSLVAEPKLSSLLASREYALVVQVCDEAFDKVANRVLFRKSDSDVAELSDMIVDVWRRTIEARTGEVGPQLDVTVNSMRAWSLIAGATINVMSPRTVTPVARALVTALKNETCQTRLEYTSKDICALLLALDEDPRFSKAQEKLLQTMCSMAGSESSDEGASYFPGSQTLIKYMRRVLSRKLLVDVGPVWSRIAPLLDQQRTCACESLVSSARFLHNVREGLRSCTDGSYVQIIGLVDRLVVLACETENEELRSEALATLLVLCSNDETRMLPVALQRIVHYLKDSFPVLFRTNASHLLENTVLAWGDSLCPFVKALLPIVLSLMTDSCEECCRCANKTFASLVRLAPLVQENSSIRLTSVASSDVDAVIDHLIAGKPLRPVVLAESIGTSLSLAGVTLRAYQQEGVAWLRFLQKLKLNGALCDSMGLGKTLQALVAIALSHSDDADDGGAAMSLIVCPSTLVGHWMAEITKFFPGSSVFRPLCYMGSKSQREALWGTMELTYNLVVTSYAVLRNDADILTRRRFRSCTLDEGHLLKNHTTATARAARRLLAKHRLVLTGTPVQNRVHELWAIFDFLMPNFLGSCASFASEFVKPIVKGQVDGASSTVVVQGLEKLRTLHQQVLPFLLRREKSEVLQELPPKVVSYIAVPMSPTQAQLYRQLCSNSTVQSSLRRLDDLLEPREKPSTAPVDGSVLKSLMLLRLLCTHPAHLSVSANVSSSPMQVLTKSGKMTALFELMRNAGLGDGCVTGADSDESLLYCDDPSESAGGFESVVDAAEDAGLVPEHPRRTEEVEKKCIIFAQFTKSLDLVENLVLKSLMPQVRYIRLDGRVPVERRAGLAQKFNSDPSVRLLLATTRVGGLGLNLTGADTVFFLENDYNPFVDIQAQDRAHRIGQTKCVNVYNLVTENSVDEKIIELQRRKVAVSEAIVNSDNSSMLSMGTDRILDVFACRSSTNGGTDESPALDMDALIEEHLNDYASLSVDEFLKGLEGYEQA